MPQTSDILREANPWWRGEFKLDYKKRKIYDQIKGFMPEKQILAFTGLRRTGKTMILLKLIKDSIIEGLDPMDVIFFSFDEQKDADIRDVIKEYESITEKSINLGRHLLVLDEIQKLDDWQNKLKWIYDTYSKNTKILISGSESLFIRKKTKETLAGRLFEFTINPLTFKEFLDFKGQICEPLGVHERELDLALYEFIHTQGFPELVGKTDQTYIKKYIEEGIRDKIIYKDIPELFGIRNTEALNSILNMLMNEPGQIIEHVKLANEFGISRYSVSKYLEYLEDSFLLKKLYNYSKNARKSERSLKKYYPSIISTSLAFKEDALYKSRVFEWLIVNQMNAKYFWRNERRSEVDIVLENGPCPVEIKYGKIDMGGVLAFMKRFKVKNGYVISARQESIQHSQDATISVIPALKVLLKPNEPFK